jgi:hypothetical protein
MADLELLAGVAEPVGIEAGPVSVITRRMRMPS